MRITRRYLACCTRRTTSTTMVFSILALVTLPVSSLRTPCAAVAICVSAVITLYLPLPPSAIPGREEECSPAPDLFWLRSEEHTSELQSHSDLVCRLLLEKKK